MKAVGYHLVEGVVIDIPRRFRATPTSPSRHMIESKMDQKKWFLDRARMLSI